MRKAYDWLEERLELSKLAWLGTRMVPRGVAWWYVFGSATLIAFVLLVVTGAFLMFNYVPSPDHAYASVQFISNSVAFGSVIRSIHHWAAYAIVLLVALHALRTFFFASYRYPREVTWITGVVLLLLVGGMAFTGYLLPWDQRSYWATTVGTDIARETPFIGNWIKALLTGGTSTGAIESLNSPALTLTRFFALHVAILPALLVIVISIHMFLVVRLGISQRPGDTALPHGTDPKHIKLKDLYQEQYRMSKQEGHPFVPDVIFHDSVAALVVVGAVFALAVLFPVVSASPANPVGTAFSPKPEWYFVWVQTFLRLFPGKIEPIGAIVIPLIAIILIFLLPFLDRGLDRRFSARKGLVGGGAFVVALMLVLEVYGFLFPPTLAVPSAPAPPPGATYGQVAVLGKPAYDNSCASCHGVNGEGVVAPALWGSKADMAEYKTADKLYDYTAGEMPIGSPGSLPHATNLDIFGYIMVENGFVSSNTPFDESQFASIPLTAHGSTATPTPTPTPTPTAPATTTAPASTFGELAESGKTVYDSNCASCHGAQGQGVSGPALWGQNVSFAYYGTASGLLSYISGNMPPGGGGSLSPQDYLNALGYILVQGNQVSPTTSFSQSSLGSISLK